MRILFDQGVPVPLRKALTLHEVATAYEMGWAGLANGNLLRAAASAFDAFVTTDKNLRHQQNLPVGKLAVLVLPTTSWPVISRHQDEVATAENDLRPGELRELSFGPTA